MIYQPIVAPSDPSVDCRALAPSSSNQPATTQLIEDVVRAQFRHVSIFIDTVVWQLHLTGGEEY